MVAGRSGAVVETSFRVFLLTLVALGAAGLVALTLTWRGVAGEEVVATQTAFLVSGGLAGEGVVGVALIILVIQARRASEAGRRAELQNVVRAAAGVLEAARRRTERGS